jgi:hypothetical protein
MEPKDRRIASGEVARIDADRIVVRLEDGTFGCLLLEEESTRRSRFSIGFRGRFQWKACAEGDMPLLTLLPNDAGPIEVEPFDREAHRLHDVLTNRHITANGREPPGDPIGEKQIEAWVVRVGDALSRVRKHRSKRLNEQF